MAVTADGVARGGFVIATPGDWFALRVPRQISDAERVTAAAVAAHPELATHRDSLRELIRNLLKACETLNLIAAYATLLDVPGGPLPASLAITVHPMDGYTLDAVAAQMSGQPDDVLMPPPSVGVFDFPAGRTARIERLAEGAGAAEDRRPVSFLAQYVTEAPGGAAIMLTFSTPALALADQLRPLFHQIACTLRFDGQELPR